MKTTTFFARVTSLTLVLALFFFVGNSTIVHGQSKSLKVASELSQLATSDKAVKSKSNSVSSVARKVNTSGISKLNELQIIDSQYVVVDAISQGNNKQLLKELKALGLKNGAAYGGMVSGLLPIDAIPNLEGIASLQYIFPVYKPLTNSGITTSQGDAALRSDELRGSLGVDGSGIVIGTLSDSYNSLNGANAGVVTGDLPGPGNPNGYSNEVVVLEEIVGAGSDEGRAMIEIIHDIAPGATQMFHSAFNGSASFAQGILKLAKAGCQIINDDVSYFAEPVFQDGIIAQAVDEVSTKYGVTYLSSAGNADRDSYESKFRGGETAQIINPFEGVIFGNYLLHDFDPGEGVDHYQEVNLTNGTSLRLALQWDEPAASVCEGCPGARNDVDIFLTLAEDPASVVLQSTNANIDGNAFEFLSAGYGGNDTVKAYVVIGKYLDTEETTPNPGTIKYISFGNYLFTEHLPNSPTCFGHSNAKNALAVGATFWFRTPDFGFNPPPINSYSSAGGNPIIYTTKGKKLRRPIVRNNPDFTAPDGGNTSFFGQQLNDGDAFPNFFGTSAAAPHAAAVVGLLEQMKGNKRPYKSIVSILKSTAIDMDDPGTSEFDKGFDFKSGAGFIQADKAAEELLKIIGIDQLKITPICTDNPENQRGWKIVNPNPFKVAVNWELIGYNQSGTLSAVPGENFVYTDTEKWYNLLLVSWDGPWGSPRKIASYSPGQKCSELKVAEDFASVDRLPSIVMSSVYPNPVIDNVTVEFYSAEGADLTANIYNLSGRLVHSSSISAVAGYNVFNAGLADLKSGMYYMKIDSSTQNNLGTYKLFKR